MIKKLIIKYRDLILYGVFGLLTTVVNWVSYKLFFSLFRIPNVPSTCIAWLLAVLFAFITNKLWVFESKSFEKRILFKELGTFFSARIATGLLDVLIMWYAVDKMNYNEDLWKLISNVIVIIINYIASKLIIFKK